MALCPECGSAIDIEDCLEEGQTRDRPYCGTELQAVDTDPVELVAVIGEEKEQEEAW
jgi:uncharacterized paraquat-inducible protein A